jgi:hypothetical protein
VNQLVLRLHKNTPTLRLPKELPDPELHFEHMKVSSSGEEADVLVAYGRYKIWGSRGDARIRWAEIAWPDDGVGICNHGAGRTLVAAVVGCFRHKCLREALQSS